MAEAPDPRRRLVGLVAGPLVFAAVLAWPFAGLSTAAHTLAAIFGLAVVYWVSEALPPPVTALLASLLAIVLAVAPAPAVLAPYADPVIFLFLGSFVLAEATRSSGLDRRLALAVLRADWASRTPGRLLAALGVVTCALSLWLSNTTTTAIMLPVGLAVLQQMGELGDAGRSRYPIGLLLMLTWSSSVAVGVPVGSPPNLIAIGMVRDLAGRHLTFVDWMAVTLPLTVVMLAVCWLILWLRYRDKGRAATPVHGWTVAEAAQLGPWCRAEVNVVVVFALAIVLWMLPGRAGLAGPRGLRSGLRRAPAQARHPARSGDTSGPAHRGRQGARRGHRAGGRDRQYAARGAGGGGRAGGGAGVSAFADALRWELSWLVRAEVPARAVRLTVRDRLVARLERGPLGAREVSESVQTTVRVAWRVVEELDAPEELVETVCRAALEAVRGQGGDSARWITEAVGAAGAVLDEQARRHPDDTTGAWLARWRRD
jgi:hypothetical protein